MRPRVADPDDDFCGETSEDYDVTFSEHLYMFGSEEPSAMKLSKLGVLVLSGALVGCAVDDPGANTSSLPGFDVVVASDDAEWRGRVHLSGHHDKEQQCEDSVRLSLISDRADFVVLLDPYSGRGVTRWNAESFIVRGGARGRFDDGATAEWEATEQGLRLSIRGRQWCDSVGCVDESTDFTVGLSVVGIERDDAFTTCAADSRNVTQLGHELCNTGDAGADACMMLISL